VCLLLGCNTGSDVEPVELRVPVLVAEATNGTVEDLIVAAGTLRAAESVRLTAETPGFLSLGRTPSGRRLGEGDRVEARQVIAMVTGEPARVAAGLRVRQERHEIAESQLRSRRRLFENGLISAEQLHESEAALAEAELELDRALMTEERSRLVTPISGVVLRLARDPSGQPVADGQLVARGFEVAHVAPIDRLIADVDLVGEDAARVRVGMSARVRHHALRGEVFDASVLRLAPVIDPLTRASRAEVEVDNSRGLLRPGMFIEVSVLVERREKVVVAPREAITERGGTRVAFVLDGQRVEARPVTLGFGAGELIEVRRGLAPGERLVVQGLETLTDGTRVRVTGR
jgi:RND family efflux transporter MFP subunit